MTKDCHCEPCPKKVGRQAEPDPPLAESNLTVGLLPARTTERPFVRWGGRRFAPRNDRSQGLKPNSLTPSCTKNKTGVRRPLSCFFPNCHCERVHCHDEKPSLRSAGGGEAIIPDVMLEFTFRSAPCAWRHQARLWPAASIQPEAF